MARDPRPHHPLAAALAGLALAVTAGAAVVVAVATPASAATTFTVSSTADAHDAQPGNGVCASASGHCTLRAAVEEGIGADTVVVVPAGTYALLLGTALIVAPNQTLTVQGAGSGRTIVSGVSLTRVFEINHMGSATIDGVTIQDGKVTRPGISAHSHGAGIHNHGRLVLSNSTLYRNLVPPTANGVQWGGGGITNATTGDATLVNVTLFANTTQSGDGAGIENLGRMRITNITVGLQWGVAGHAAVANAPGASLVAENSVFERSLATCNGQPCNSAPNCHGAITWWFSISNDQTCAFGAGYDGLPSPLVGPFDSATGTFPMILGSPGLDAAVPAMHGGRDQLGGVRPADGDCNGSAVEDLGAVEYQPTIRLGNRVIPGCTLRPIGPATPGTGPVLRPVAL